MEDADAPEEQGLTSRDPSACGIDSAEAAKDIVIRRVQDVDIPFASPCLLWRMKISTHLHQG